MIKYPHSQTATFAGSQQTGNMRTIALLIITLLAGSQLAIAQNFEGYLVYKVEVENPNPKMIPDSVWQEVKKEKLGERGYMLQKSFYKGDRYLTEMEFAAEQGFQAYNPEDSLIYSWEKGTSTALTLKSTQYLDKLEKVEHLDETETIMEIPCKAVRLSSKLGETTLWYNPEYFTLDASLYKDHVYGHWNTILEEIGCIPIKIEQRSPMASMTQTVIEYKEEALPESTFALPEFEEVMANPFN